MKELIRKFIAFKNLFGLLYIVFNFVYVGLNMYLNKGNYVINSILLVLIFLYLILYVYSVYIEQNKKVKKASKKIFVRSKKFLGFVNACMILASVFSNEVNSFSTIFLAIITIFWFFFYFSIDIASSLALHEFKKYSRELGWKHDHRD